MQPLLDTPAETGVMEGDAVMPAGEGDGVNRGVAAGVDVAVGDGTEDDVDESLPVDEKLDVEDGVDVAVGDGTDDDVPESLPVDEKLAVVV